MHKIDQNIIEIKDVSFDYGSQEVLKDITFNVHKGDYLGIIGPNGGGKTTLLKIMLGLQTPKSGTVTLFGQDISSFTDWSRIGYVSQHVVDFENNFPVTVWEVVAMGLYGKKGLFRGLNSKDRKEIERALKNVEMHEFSKRLIGDLSGGQQQRVFIARALVSNPEILFLDEPTAGVDLNVQEKFYKLLHELNVDHDLTLVLVSHDVEVIANEATEFASINQKLIYHGSPEEFMNGNYMENAYAKNLKYIHHH